MTGNITFSYKGKTGKKTVIEDVDDDKDKVPDTDFDKSVSRVYDKIDHVKDGVLPLSKLVDLIETFGGGVVVRICRFICGK